MSALASVRRKRTAVMLTVNLLAVVALGGFGLAGVRALKRYEGATKVSVESKTLPITPIGMLATVDSDDVLTSIAIFVLKAGDQLGGSIVSVPVSSDSTAGGGEDRVPLTQVYAEGGAEALVLGVESVLSITIDVSSVASAADAEGLLNPVSPVAAQLPTDVLGTSSVGTVTLFDAGEHDLSAAETAEVLTATADGQRDADRRGNIEALWSGVAAAVGAGRTTADAAVDGVASIASLGDLMNRLFAAPVEARGLPAAPLPAADNPGDKDVEELIRYEAIFVLAEGVATPVEIDEAMKLGANHPIGPLALCDLIGLDVDNLLFPVERNTDVITRQLADNFLEITSGDGDLSRFFDLCWDFRD